MDYQPTLPVATAQMDYQSTLPTATRDETAYFQQHVHQWTDMQRKTILDHMSYHEQMIGVLKSIEAYGKPMEQLPRLPKRPGTKLDVLLQSKPVKKLSADTVYDVLCIADKYMLPGLKRQCANCMSEYIDVDNVITILRTARLFQLRRLESDSAEFIADHLEDVIGQDEFLTFLMEDPSNLHQRRETDSIDIIDEVHFCRLTEKLCCFIINH